MRSPRAWTAMHLSGWSLTFTRRAGLECRVIKSQTSRWPPMSLVKNTPGRVGDHDDAVKCDICCYENGITYFLAIIIAYRWWYDRCIANIFTEDFDAPVTVGEKYFGKRWIPLDAIHRSHMARKDRCHFFRRRFSFSITRNNPSKLGPNHELGRHRMFIF